MTSIAHRKLEANGIGIHVAEAGEGPLVLLLHGFPEGWYSWRHQLVALAEAGYHAVAPDQRGYGQTDAPEPIDRYSVFDLTGDVVGLLDALSPEPAVLVGHDWGAPVAWHTALFRPDRVRAVAGLSVPFRPRGSTGPPLELYRRALGERFYQVYFQEPGVAEKDLERDVRRTLLGTLYGLSGDAPQVADMMVPEGGFAAAFAIPERLPAWLTEADVDHFAAEFARTGFRGGLNWYRNIDRNWEQMAPWRGARVQTPALYAVGDRDVVYHFPGGQEAAAGLQEVVPNLTRTLVLEGCGHWTQQERPAAVNAALLEFLSGLG